MRSLRQKCSRQGELTTSHLLENSSTASFFLTRVLTAAPLRGRRHLFVTLRRIAFEPINRRGLGGSEGEPILRVLLEQAKELLAVLLGGFVDFVPALELALEGEFSDELFFATESCRSDPSAATPPL